MADKKNFVAEIVSDPSDVPDCTVLTGYPGDAGDDDHLRLYLTVDLGEHLDIPEASILHRMDVPKETDPLGAVRLWVDREAVMTRRGRSVPELTEKFFSGSIMENYAQKAQEVAQKASDEGKAAATLPPMCPPTQPILCPTEQPFCDPPQNPFTQQATCFPGPCGPFTLTPDCLSPGGGPQAMGMGMAAPQQGGPAPNAGFQLRPTLSGPGCRTVIDPGCVRTVSGPGCNVTLNTCIPIACGDIRTLTPDCRITRLNCSLLPQCSGGFGGGFGGGGGGFQGGGFQGGGPMQEMAAPQQGARGGVSVDQPCIPPTEANCPSLVDGCGTRIGCGPSQIGPCNSVLNCPTQLCPSQQVCPSRFCPSQQFCPSRVCPSQGFCPPDSLVCGGGGGGRFGGGGFGGGGVGGGPAPQAFTAGACSDTIGYGACPVTYSGCFPTRHQDCYI